MIYLFIYYMYLLYSLPSIKRDALYDVFYTYNFLFITFESLMWNPHIVSKKLYVSETWYTFFYKQ